MSTRDHTVFGWGDEVYFDYGNRRIIVRDYSQTYNEVTEDMPAVTETRRFEYKTNRSNKFWEVTTNIASRTYEVKYGAIGSSGVHKQYGPFSTSRLRTEVSRKCNGKLAKGYAEVEPAEPKPKRKSRKREELTGEDLIYELDI